MIPENTAGTSKPRTLDTALADWVLAKFAKDKNATEKAQLKKLIQAVSHAVYLKHSCLDLTMIKQLQEPLLDDLLEGMDGGQVTKLLEKHWRPLEYSDDGQRIWLQKYHFFEQSCVRKIRSMTAQHLPVDDQDRKALQTLFPLNDKATELEKTGRDQQMAASHMALKNRFAMITGGPGTGKTYTLARIIALLLQADGNCHITLAAPTGKAGQRMRQALEDAMNEPAIAALQIPVDRIPQTASTLHSLLGIGYHSPRPRYHHRRTLNTDVLIIDEASMIDLPMMHRLLDALNDHTRLILLGDKDQLASVEAGSVLGELCQCQTLAHCTANITVSRRFAHKPAIGALAAWLNDFANAEQPDFTASADVTIHTSIPGTGWHPIWLEQAAAAYKALQQSIADQISVADILARQTDFQLLCALRHGPFGVTGINSLIEKKLGKSEDNWYPGKPLMITRNDRARKLFNGDVGMVLPLSDDDQFVDINSDRLKACFLTENGFKAISRSQMPEYETCYALTVHKSQGSEYCHVIIILPDNAEDVRSNPVLTKELAYTAVTRARDHIDIYAGRDVLAAMAQQTTARMSGLGWMMENR